MLRISNFQLYCMLLILVAPVAVLEQPHRLIHIAHNNGWWLFITAILPGMLLVFMYSYIIKKSSQPFPVLLEQHLGKFLGKTLGCFYIFAFFLTCAFNLRVFIEFMKMIVLPATPISIFIGVILFLGFVAIKIGLSSIARISEIIMPLGLSFTFIITIISVSNHPTFERILPIAWGGFKTFGIGTFIATSILGKMMPVLSFAYFLPDIKKAPAIMMKVLATYVALLTFVTICLITTLGIFPSMSYVFPTFNMIRLAHIGEFVQNLDIVFISVWILGVFGAVTINWFIGCFTIQKVFNLQDYRFLAAPSMFIIGFLSIIMGRNNLEIITWSLSIIPIIFVLFFIVIPFLIFIICCFKPVPEIAAPKPENSPDPVNKQELAG